MDLSPAIELIDLSLAIALMILLLAYVEPRDSLRACMEANVDAMADAKVARDCRSISPRDRSFSSRDCGRVANVSEIGESSATL